MEEDEQKKSLDLTGPEIISLAGSLALCLANKYDKKSLDSLRSFFQAVASNISIIEFQGLNKNSNKNQ